MTEEQKGSVTLASARVKEKKLKSTIKFSSFEKIKFSTELFLL